MGERWVSIELVGDDALTCHSCHERTDNQKVHLYIDVDDEIAEVMCANCWNEKGRKL